MVDHGTPLVRRRALLLAFLIGCAVVWLLGAIPRWGLWYSPHPYYRAQAHALLQGRFALSHDPGGLALDLAWVDGGVQQVWGLGVPLWLALWELIGRVVHLTPFPDRIAMLFGAVAMFYALLRAWLGPGGDRSAASRGAFLFTALAPAVVTMLRGYIGVYEEAAAYAYGATMLLLAGVLAMIRRPATGRYVLLVAFAGATGLIRPTVWFYGTAAAVVATVLYVRHRGSLRRALGPVALATGLFLAGGGALYATNAVRFGAGGEFGHRLNLEDVPGNLHATRFDYPFRTAPLAVAARDLAGAMFGRPELAEHRAYYDRRIHAGQAPIARFREYYFTTYTWPYLPLALAGLVCAVIAWLRAGRAAAAPASASGALRTVPDLDRETRWLGDAPGAATRLKVVLNHWILSLTEAIGETIAFSRAVGVDPALALETIEGGTMDTPYLQMKGKAILEGALDPAFPLPLAVKDSDLVLEAAEEAGIDLPLIEVARRQFARALELGHGDKDMAATYFATSASATAGS